MSSHPVQCTLEEVHPLSKCTVGGLHYHWSSATIVQLPKFSEVSHNNDKQPKDPDILPNTHKCSIAIIVFLLLTLLCLNLYTTKAAILIYHNTHDSIQHPCSNWEKQEGAELTCMPWAQLLKKPSDSSESCKSTIVLVLPSLNVLAAPSLSQQSSRLLARTISG